jgi:hypothetical protein
MRAMNAFDELRQEGKMIWIVNRSTGFVASTIWVNRASPAQPILFITIDGEPVKHRHCLDVEPGRTVREP